MNLKSYLLMIAIVWFPANVFAVVVPPIPTDPIYFEPPIEDAPAGSDELTCYQIDLAINKLHPYRYSYKPEYYDDSMNKLATTLVVFDAVPIVQGWLGLGYLGYSAAVGEKEQRRVLVIEQKISALQNLKALKHCYE
ncbi:hypothetical protein LCGC14_2223030 [marine sediment metagenome]|uniref:Uncharacterized protein n=1 Tax=marine sediment metagenome TaxID=412755 RepID=A0A0F9DAG2_9ZZZZ